MHPQKRGIGHRSGVGSADWMHRCDLSQAGYIYMRHEGYGLHDGEERPENGSRKRVQGRRGSLTEAREKKREALTDARERRGGERKEQREANYRTLRHPLLSLSHDALMI